MQGIYCVHVKSLPVSAMATISTGGVPIEIFMRYSPGIGKISDWIVSLALAKEFFLKKDARENERWKEFRRRFDGLFDGL